MNNLFVTCPGECEVLLMQELQEMGITVLRKGFRGAYVAKTMENVYKINYLSRIATRVLWPLAKFKCRDKEDLYNGTASVDWSSFLTLEKTFAIDSNVSHPNLRNSLFASLIMKDAICDTLRDKWGQRPNINVASPDVQFNLFIQGGIATLSFDTSNTPLYKRGYRQESTVAPLQENIAAAILMQSGYTSEEILCDPFCGSGTFLIEAAMKATQTPAGFFRKSWGFFHMPEYVQEDWQSFKNTADAQKIPLAKGKIFGIDVDSFSIEICNSHLKATGFQDAIELIKKGIATYTPAIAPTYIISNPPYGKRLEVSSGTFRALGHFLKARCAPQFKAFILHTDHQMVKATGLPIRNTTPLRNGGLSVNLFSL